MNWGRGIVLALAAFIGFIMYMVVQMYQNNVDLVEDDYYAQGVNIDNRVQATENALAFEKEFILEQTPSQIKVIFPAALNMEDAKGIIHFYRPEKATLDRKIPIQTTQNFQVIEKSDITLGNFIVKLIFSTQGKEYYIEKKIFVKK